MMDVKRGSTDVEGTDGCTLAVTATAGTICVVGVETVTVAEALLNEDLSDATTAGRLVDDRRVVREVSRVEWESNVVRETKVVREIVAVTEGCGTKTTGTRRQWRSCSVEGGGDSRVECEVDRLVTVRVNKVVVDTRVPVDTEAPAFALTPAGTACLARMTSSPCPAGRCKASTRQTEHKATSHNTKCIVRK